MPTITDVPLEIFLDNLFPLLPVPDLLSLEATNRFFYQLTSDETFWKRKIQKDYNFPDSDTARTTGWKFIYKRLSNPKIYVWGEHSRGRLGISGRDLPNPLYDGIPFPMRLRIPWVRIVNLVAGGMSFHAIDAQGHVYVWGALDGTSFALRTDGFSDPSKVAESPMRLELPCAIRQISCARLHSAALDTDAQVWTFTSWGRPFKLQTALLDRSSRDTTPVQVECGWGFTSILTQGGDVLVNWPSRGRMLEEIHRIDQELNQAGDVTQAKPSPERPGIIPCHVWDMGNIEPYRLPAIPAGLPRLAGTGLPTDVLDGETRLVKIAGMDNFLVGLTNKGHVLKYDRLESEESYQRGHWEYLPSFSELEKVSQHPVFAEGQLKPPSTMHITQISAHFKTFTAYSTGPESVVLMCRMQTTDEEGPISQQRLEPTIIPSLQYRGVISVILGDYHYGALTEAGKLLTWGAFSKGALGLGDPVDIEPGQPGGFSTREQRLAMTNAPGHMLATPPDVRDPTEVRFDHKRKNKGKETYVFAAAAAGWHMGALVIDLESDDEDEEQDSSQAIPGAFPDDTTPPQHDRWQGPPILPIRGHRGVLPFRIGFAGRGIGRGGAGRGQ
ncbi:uncharacterized protein PHACADRAFT_264421 [Phanerochaete carnosa HHB-10118-sp]|uniref:F-box domain-containing protein n=1 Tax=Phanerochaete carnosa (strain HHB-10118-sp) TaxID=650164 RepID=K5VFM3_PHACS|nr:uncharacterized protein PHACADRAFT_264421 [Phanerochaete carnosa HHB-10118-sp]EKM49963.1 hypothetical protein PHACADRAFT_264421 [Phanerochaete carnosa HHB-10118-sp]